MGLALGPKGKLFVLDSKRGRVWSIRSIEPEATSEPK
jgi:hypothetical protein